MTSSHGRRIQSRRALAILAWLSLVLVAGLLWYAQEHRFIRIQAWEPAALLLSAYSAFLSVFGWLLFSPERKSAEESPALFFAGILTLLPPCFIAYHLMPEGSPLRGWLTIGIFLFGIIAILSPLPKEVFAVPRHRRSYLQPLTDSYLSILDVDAPGVSFDGILPQTAFRLTRPDETATAVARGPARDPWTDPFYGTGRRLSRTGVSQSRRKEESGHGDVSYRESNRQNDGHPAAVPVAAVPQTNVPLATQTPSSANQMQHVPNQGFTEDQSAPRSPGATAATSRRPLTEPEHRPSAAAGFQTPRPFPLRSVPLPQIPPPLPSTSLRSEASVGDTEFSLRELDRQLRLMQVQDDEEPETTADDDLTTGAAPRPVAGVFLNQQLAAGDATLERIRDEHGGEMIEGTIPVMFEIGQKRAHLHVPFSPPLPGLPEVECEPTSEDSIRLKVAVRQPYGIRIEARRSEASESLKTEISFAAVYTPGSKRSSTSRGQH